MDWSVFEGLAVMRVSAASSIGDIKEESEGDKSNKKMMEMNDDLIGYVWVNGCLGLVKWHRDYMK